ncbi:unnamed protein product [Staurois parvus]|uniref:Uncharacterized protein n=1 Tax=Staurois parvus TaxID=386267 RepID=A0ABN9E405_9NEOB|nr:unnamed protein product [Staurois parvus]
MGCFQELSEFKRGTVIGCHLCNKSIREIFGCSKILLSELCPVSLSPGPLLTPVPRAMPKWSAHP